MKTITRVFDLLRHNLEKFPKEEFISGKINGVWKKYSTQSFCDTTDQLSRGLATLGVKKGSRVGVMSANRPEWNICDYAISQLGAYQIPLYPTLAEHDIKFMKPPFFHVKVVLALINWQINDRPLAHQLVVL